MTFEEFTYWKVFCTRFEPFGDEWRQAATTAWAACFDKVDGSGSVRGPEDLMPLVWPDVSKDLEREAREAQRAHEKWREENEVEEDVNDGY